jgi:Leucine-rich repeat (LRR) protein
MAAAELSVLSLSDLDLSGNPLESVEGLSGLVCLKRLRLNHVPFAKNLLNAPFHDDASNHFGRLLGLTRLSIARNELETVPLCVLALNRCVGTRRILIKNCGKT